MTPTLDRANIQALLATGHGRLPSAHFTLFAASDRAGAGRLLAWLLPRLTRADGHAERPDRAWQVAYTPAGLRRLGLPEGAVGGFSAEFTGGMIDPRRSRLLGDIDGSDPRGWAWGGPGSPDFDGIILTYAAGPPVLAGMQAELAEAFRRCGVRAVAELPTLPLAGREQFGFADGISQPVIAGLSTPPTGARTVPVGEFVLGYPNAHGLLTDRPLLPPDADPDRLLPTDAGGSGAADLGRDGSYLVVRQLAQDVDGFWRYAREVTRRRDGSLDEPASIALAARMMGRWPSGAPLVKAPDRDDPALADDNNFGYHHTDPTGYACPLGAHIRRTNPRDSLDPKPGTEASLAVNDRHRLLRCNRSYGPSGDANPTGERGLYFLCMVGNLARQFEFVQHTWLNNPGFHGRYAETDPLVGSRPPGASDFTVPARPVRRRYRAVPQFVRTRGGGYFFLPSLPALHYLARLAGSPGRVRYDQRPSHGPAADEGAGARPGGVAEK